MFPDEASRLPREVRGNDLHLGQERILLRPAGGLRPGLSQGAQGKEEGYYWRGRGGGGGRRGGRGVSESVDDRPEAGLEGEEQERVLRRDPSLPPGVRRYICT